MKMASYSNEIPDDKLEIIWENNKCGFINKDTQKVIVPCVYDTATKFTRGLSIVCIEKDMTFFSQEGNYFSINKKYGLINSKGEQITPIKYGYISEESLAKDFITFCTTLEKCGYMNREGTEVIPAAYKDASDFSEGYAIVQKKKYVGYIDEQGDLAIPFQYESARGFLEGLAAVSKNGKWGVIDKAGKTIVPFIYDDIQSFFHGQACVRRKGKWGTIDKNGNETKLCIYDKIIQISNGTAFVSLENKWGLIDNKRNILCPFIYDEVSIWPGGQYFRVKKEGKIGRIDPRGHTDIPIEYDSFIPIQNYILISKNGKFGVINSSQDIIIPLEYDDYHIFEPEEEWIYLKKANKWGAFNLRNNKKIPFIYDSIGKFYRGRLRVEKNNELFHIDFDNNRLPLIPRPTKYSKIQQILSPFNELVKDPLRKEFKDTAQRDQEITNFDNQIISHIIQNIQTGKYPLLENADISTIPQKNKRDIQCFSFDFKDFELLVRCNDYYSDEDNGYYEVFVNFECKIQNIREKGIQIPRYIKALEINIPCAIKCLEETLDILFTEIAKCKKKYLGKREK